MKKEFLIIALILAVVLMLTPFPGNKTEGYYDIYGNYLQDIGCPCFDPYVSMDPRIIRVDCIPSENGYIFIETRAYDPNSTILYTESGGLPSESDPAQNTSVPVQVDIFPGIMFPLWTDFNPYSAFPADSEWIWPDFTAMPSSCPILLWISDFSPNPYWLDIYPAIFFYFP